MLHPDANHDEKNTHYFLFIENKIYCKLVYKSDLCKKMEW